MTTPRDITSTSTPKENNTVPLDKQISTLVPDNYLSGNLFNHKFDRMHYPLNDTDGESEKDSYSEVPMITERQRKQQFQRQPTHFGFENNHDYTINTATPRFHENQKVNPNEENFNKLLEKMENRFHRMSENMQRKHETQLNEAFEQIQQTIIEFNTQQNQRKGFNDHHTRNTQIPEFRPQRSEKQNNDTQNNSVTEPPLPFYKQLTSMSINEELQPDISSSNGSVPTTKNHLTAQIQDIHLKNT